MKIYLDERSNICNLCQKEIKYDDIVHYDHIISLYNGGNNSISNFQRVHARCNLLKGKG